MIEGTHRTLDRVKVLEGVETVVLPVWVIFKPVPSPITIASEPSYAEVRERPLRSSVT